LTYSSVFSYAAPPQEPLPLMAKQAGDQHAQQKCAPEPKRRSTQQTKSSDNHESNQDSKLHSGQESKPAPEQAPKKAPKLPPKQPSKQTPAKKQNGGSEDGQDLTTILAESQRAYLTLLLASATMSMRRLIVDNFDASAGLSKALLRENMSEDEKLMSADVDPGTADVVALDREKRLKEQYTKELSTPNVRDLKGSALRAFDEWRQTVIERVGQVVNSERTAKGQLDKDSKAGEAQPQAPDQNRLESVVKRPPRNEGIKPKFKDLYPPTKTPLTKLSMQQRTLVIHSMLLLLLSLEHYTAPSRVLLLHLTSSLKMPLKTFEQDETTVAKGLLEAAKEMSASEETKKKAEANKENRKWKVSLATAAGAAVIGISGGMAAPLVSAGVGTIMGSLGLGATAAAGYLGSVAGSTMLVGGLFGAYGGRMTGQMMDKYAREVEDFEFLPVHSRNKTSEKAEEGAKQASEHNHKLRVTICISGWLTENDEVVSPWKVIGRGAEVFALKWELEALLNLGNAMNGLVQSAAWGYAQKQLIQQTIFADLMAAMWPVGLVKAAGVIDNPFSVAKGRSEKAGEVLADAIINRAQGERPVTLIGYSLGARVIYTCLMSLAKRKAFGLIESAVLIGAPTPSDTSDWRAMRSAVSARLVNIYSENDYVLGFMYRTSSVQYGVAGLQKVEGLSGVENVNVSEDVKGHLRYRYLIGGILKKIGFEDIDMQAVEEEHVALEKMEEEEEKNSLRAQKNRLLRRESSGGKEDEAKEAEEEANEIQKQVAAKTQKSLVTRVVEYFYLPKTSSAKDVEKNLGNLQKAAADPGEAGSVAVEAVKDIQASGQSYAQWAAQKLPSLPGRGEGAVKAASDPAKAAMGAANGVSTTQSYTQAAASYLPSFGGGAKKKPKDPAKAAGDVAKVTENAVEQTPVVGTVKDTTKPTVVNASKMAGNAATSGKDAVAGAESKAEKVIDQTPAKVVKDTTKPTVVNASKTIGTTVEGAKDGVGGAASKGAGAAGNAAVSAQKSTGDAASSAKSQLGDGVSSAQNAIGDTATSAQGYTQRAARYLPSLGGSVSVGGKKTSGKTRKTAEKTGECPAEDVDADAAPGNTVASAQSYTSKAAGYLPTFDGGRKAAQGISQAAGDAAKDSPKKASDATRKPTKVAGNGSKALSKTAGKGTANAKDATETTTASVSEASKVATGTAASTQSYTSRAAGYLPSLTGIPGRGKATAATDATTKPSTGGRTDSPKPPSTMHQDSNPSAKKTADNDGKKANDTKEAESKTEKPSPRDRTPSEPTKKAPKLNRKSSETPKKAAPKPERKASEAIKSTSKLESQNSEAKSPLKLDGKSSGVDSPPAKPQRTVSGARQSTPKLDRTPSERQASTEKLQRTSSVVKSMAPKLDRFPSGVKKPQETVQRGVSGLTGALVGK
jgi:Protein of unknown function (DUF726)